MPLGFKRFGRKGTRSQTVTVPESSGSIPQAIEPTPQTVPSYKDQDRQKGEQDVDDQIQSAEGGREDKDKGPAETAQVKETKQSDRLNVREQTTAKATASGPFSRLWSKYTDHKLTTVSYGTKARFVPNGIPLMRLAYDALDLVSSTNWIAKNEVKFNPYACATALAYLYYIQILRAKEAAHDLRGLEASALSRLRKTIKEEAIIIPEPFLPYFYSLVSTQLEDAKYEWVIPTFGSLTGLTSYGHLGTDATARDLGNLRPNIPFMLAQLATFGSTRQTDLAAHMNEDRIYTPVNFDRTANATTRLYGEDLRMDRANWTNSDNAIVLLQLGANYPFSFQNGNYDEARKDMRRSSFFGEELSNPTASQVTTGIDVCLVPNRDIPGTGIQFLETKDIRNIDSFLFLEKEKNADWVHYLFDQLAVFAKHFTGNKTLSDIPTTGGLESSILCQLRKHQATAGSYLYADHKLGFAGTRDVTWYSHDRFKRLTAYFRTTRGDIERNEQLQAFAFGINSLPPIAGITELNIRSGEYFTHMGHGADVDLMEYGNAANTAPGMINMYQGWQTDYVRPVFKSKPE
nr:capsid protein [Sarcosphaera coronaria partitivirus]